MPKREKDEEIDWVTLQSVADVYMGAVTKRIESTDGSGLKISCVNVGDIDQHRIGIKPDQLGRLNIESSESVERYELRDKDILLACRGTVNKAALVTKDYQGCIASSGLVIIRPETASYSACIYTYLRSAPGLSELESMSRSSISKAVSLSVSDIKQMSVPIPSERLRERISSLIESTEQFFDIAQDYILARRELGASLAAAILFREEANANRAK